MVTKPKGKKNKKSASSRFVSSNKAKKDPSPALLWLMNTVGLNPGEVDPETA